MHCTEALAKVVINVISFFVVGIARKKIFEDFFFHKTDISSSLKVLSIKVRGQTLRGKPAMGLKVSNMVWCGEKLCKTLKNKKPNSQKKSSI